MRALHMRKLNGIDKPSPGAVGNFTECAATWELELYKQFQINARERGHGRSLVTVIMLI